MASPGSPQGRMKRRSGLNEKGQVLGGPICLDRRQGEDDDRGNGGNRGRFQFGDDDNDDNGNRGGRGFGGDGRNGRGRGGDDEDDDDDWRGRGRFSGAGRFNGNGDGDGRGGFGNGRGRSRFGNNNGNGRGGGDGNGNGRGNGGGNGNGRGNGNGNGNGRGGNGNGRGNGGGNDNGRGDGDGDDDDGFPSRNGGGGDRGFGFGNRFDQDRGGDFGGNRNGGDGGDDDTAMITSSEPETPASSSGETTPAPQATTTDTPGPVPPSEDPSAATTTTTGEAPTEPNPDVILLQPAITGISTPEANPTVTQFVPLVSPSNTASSADAPGLGGSSVSNIPTSNALGPSPPPLPTPPSTGGPMDDNGRAGGSGENGGDGNDSEIAQVGGMNSTTERILISVSSIGGFILLCFIAWVIWRSLRRTRRDGHARSSRGILPLRTASKMPFFRRRGWQNLDRSEIRESALPSNHEKAGSGSYPSMGNLYGHENPLSQQLPRQQQWPHNEINEGVAAPGQDPTYPGIMYHQPPASTTPGRPHITLMTNLPMAYTHQPQGSFSSTTAAAQFGAIVGPAGTANSSPVNPGASPASYYSQPLLSQQYNNPSYKQPPYPQLSRMASEASSLSSGFGDGDIIVTDPLITVPAPTAAPGQVTTNSSQPQPPPPPPPPQQQQQQLQQQPQYTTRFSWMTATTARQSAAAAVRAAGQGEGTAAQPSAPLVRNDSSVGSAAGQRETIYTETSEDHPTRFRSVASWVDQQKGRIRRAQRAGAMSQAAAATTATIPGDPGIPGVHNPPREQSFDLMMDDGQAPRPVDEVVPGLRKAEQI